MGEKLQNLCYIPKTRIQCIKLNLPNPETNVDISLESL